MFSEQNAAKGKATSCCNSQVLQREGGFGESVGFFSPRATVTAWWNLMGTSKAAACSGNADPHPSHCSSHALCLCPQHLPAAATGLHGTKHRQRAQGGNSNTQVCQGPAWWKLLLNSNQNARHKLSRVGQHQIMKRQSGGFFFSFLPSAIWEQWKRTPPSKKVAN